MTARAYPGSRVVEVIDGDSVRVDVDVGFNLRYRALCRLHGVAARELREPGGPEARAHLAGLLPAGTVVRVVSVAWDKYGRVAAVLHREADGLDINAAMVAGSWAAPWDGRGIQPKPPWPIPAA